MDLWRPSTNDLWGLPLAVLAVLAFCTCPLGLQGQDFSHRNFRVDWSGYHPVVMEPDSKYANEDALVLDFEVLLDFRRQQIEVYQRWYFRNALGLDLFNLFWIPWNPDPIKQPNEKQPALWLGEKDVRQLDARLLRGQSAQQIILDEWAVNREFITTNSRVKRWAYGIKAVGLQPGDELEIFFRYNMQGNFRLFPYLRVPVQRFELRMVGRPLDNPFLLTGGNWTFDSLPDGQLRVVLNHVPDLQGSPFRQNLSKMHWLSFAPSMAGQNNAQAAGWNDVYAPWVDYRPNRPEALLGEPSSPEMAQLNRIFLKVFANSLPGGKFEKLLQLQRNLNHEFNYQNDSLYLAGEDTQMERLRYFLENNTLRQRSMEKIYRALLYRTGLPVYMVFFRHTNLSLPEDSLAHWVPDFVVRGFAVETDSGMVWLVPRNHAFGWEANELPFYLRNQTHWLVPISLDYSTWVKTAKETVLRQEAPKLNSKPAERRFDGHIYLFEKAGQCRVEAQVELKGDWSTLFRGRLLFDFIDTLADPTYGQLPTLFPGDQVVGLKCQDSKLEYQAPFTFTGKISYHLAHELNLVPPFALNLTRLLPMPLPPSQLRGFPGGYREDFPQISSFTWVIHWPETLQPPRIPESLQRPGSLSSPWYKIQWSLLPKGANALEVSWTWESHIGTLDQLPPAGYRTQMKQVERLWLQSIQWD